MRIVRPTPPDCYRDAVGHHYRNYKIRTVARSSIRLSSMPIPFREFSDFFTYLKQEVSFCLENIISEKFKELV